MTEPQKSPAPSQSGLGARLKSMTSSEFLRNVLTLMTGTTLAQVVIFATTPIITRLGVTTEMWGIYNGAFMAVAGFLIPVAALRYDMAIVLPRNDDDARQLFRLSTALNTGISLLAAAAMVLWGDELAAWLITPHEGQQYFAEQVAPWLPMVGLIIWGYAQVNIVNYWSNRRKQYKVTSTNTMVNSLTTAGGRMFVAWAALGPIGLVVATLLGQAAALTNFFIRSGKDVLRAPGKSRSTMELIRAYSKMPLLNAPNALVDAIRISGIPATLSHFFGAGTTGAFNMAWTLVQTPMNLINAALSQVFFQKLSVTPRGRMYRAIRMSIVRSLAIGILPFALIWALGPWFMPIFLGEEWRGAGVVAAILVPWLYINFVTSPVSTVFVVARRQGLALFFATIYMVTPLAIIWTTHDDLNATLKLVSWSMAVLLCCYLGLALYVAKAYDNGFGAEHDAKQTGETTAAVAEEQVEQTSEIPGDQVGQS
ncbi:lipopolysaccharide biosynthesis protein [Luteococcus sp. OSA5]|uniref:lipopolysaccharide biosynthesis protein n=1 Tax=Luteococcus sp. OSA5 TaxID=3401630 RepID=UPI003B427972